MTAVRSGSLWALAGCMLATAGAAAFGGYFTAKAAISVTYAALQKPVWAPPGWAFGPVWTVLYLCMGVAGWLVWKQAQQHTPAARRALGLWWVQLGVNAGWPVVFYLQPAGLAPAVVCGGLTCLVGVCCWTFFRCSRRAAALMVPYVLWLGLATALSFALWRMRADSF